MAILPNRVSAGAVVSLLLGISSLVFSLITGLPALILGLHSLREINRSEGRERGRTAAIVGMVLGGIGTLAGLVFLLAALLLQAQVRAKQIECRNNLMYIGQAVSLYANDHKEKDDPVFPPATLPHPGLPPERRLSWLVAILPYLEQQRTQRKNTEEEKIYPLIDLGQSWDAEVNRRAVNTPMLRFLCPAHPEHAVHHEPAWTNYVGIAGLGADAATLPAGDKRAGILGYERQTRFTDVNAGLSYTMLATETAWENGLWAAGGSATVRDVDPQQQPYIGPGRPFGGLHPKSLNVLYGDGRVTPMDAAVDPTVFEAIALIRRK